MSNQSGIFRLLALVSIFSLLAWSWVNLVKLPVITATGVGEYKVKAEKVTMVVTRLDAGTTAAGATMANQAAMEKLIAVAKNYGGKDVEVKKSNYQLNAQQGQFVVASGLNIVSTNLKSLDDMVKELYVAGAATVSNITYLPENRIEADGKTKDVAIRNAKLEAERLAKSAGKRLGRMISMLEDTTGGNANLIDAISADDNNLILTKKVQVVYEIW